MILILSNKIKLNFFIFIKLVKEIIKSYILYKLVNITLELKIKAIIKKKKLIINIIYFN